MKKKGRREEGGKNKVVPLYLVVAQHAFARVNQRAETTRCINVKQGHALPVEFHLIVRSTDKSKRRRFGAAPSICDHLLHDITCGVHDSALVQIEPTGPIVLQAGRQGRQGWQG